MIKNAFKGIVFPLITASFFAFICQPIYMCNGKCDFFLLLLLIGIPFGFQKIALWIIPSSSSISELIGFLTISILLGGIIGIFVLAAHLIASIVLLIVNIMRFILP